PTRRPCDLTPTRPHGPTTTSNEAGARPIPRRCCAWPDNASTCCSPCCGTAPSTNHAHQQSTWPLDEKHRGTPRAGPFPDSLLALWLSVALSEDGSVAKTPVSWLSLNTCGVKNSRMRCFIRLLGVETPGFSRGEETPFSFLIGLTKTYGRM